MIDKNLHNLNLFTKLLFYRLNCNKNTETKDPKVVKEEEGGMYWLCKTLFLPLAIMGAIPRSVR